jgi:multisubunit Na+/H+ antiporter MnhE subunit
MMEENRPALLAALALAWIGLHSEVDGSWPGWLRGVVVGVAATTAVRTLLRAAHIVVDKAVQEKAGAER